MSQPEPQNTPLYSVDSTDGSSTARNTANLVLLFKLTFILTGEQVPIFCRSMQVLYLPSSCHSFCWQNPKAKDMNSGKEKRTSIPFFSESNVHLILKDLTSRRRSEPGAVVQISK
jgi:hypothetical protein